MGNSTPISGQKPTKPRADFPLFPHQNGQWCKKLKGVTRFFGKWDNPDAALDLYLNERDEWLAGRNPRKRKLEGKPTLAELANVYLADCAKRVTSGAMTQRTLDGYTTCLKRLATFRSKHESPEYWEPQDFAELKEAFFAPVKREKGPRGDKLRGVKVDRRASTSVDIDIRTVKAFLNWCADSELIPTPRYGKSFSQTPAKQKRLRRAEVGPRDLTPIEVRSYIDNASLYFKPIILLAMNTAMGSSDIASLKVSDYENIVENFPPSEWLQFARQKTGIDRKWWLWPETIAAINAYLETRPRRQPDHRLFLTKFRSPWLENRDDAIGQAFSKLRDDHGLRGTFYDLRRTFATVSEQTLDFVCSRYLMGHAPTNSDMGSVYRQRISDERIRKVCEHVRTWLFGGAA